MRNLVYDGCWVRPRISGTKVDNLVSQKYTCMRNLIMLKPCRQEIRAYSKWSHWKFFWRPVVRVHSPFARTPEIPRGYVIEMPKHLVQQAPISMESQQGNPAGWYSVANRDAMLRDQKHFHCTSKKQLIRQENTTVACSNPIIDVGSVDKVIDEAKVAMWKGGQHWKACSMTIAFTEMTKLHFQPNRIKIIKILTIRHRKRLNQLIAIWPTSQTKHQTDFSNALKMTLISPLDILLRRSICRTTTTDPNTTVIVTTDSSSIAHERSP